MRKIIMSLRSKFGTILDVVKQDEEYMLVTQDGLVTTKTYKNNEYRVAKLKLFIDELMSQGWKIV